MMITETESLDWMVYKFCMSWNQQNWKLRVTQQSNYILMLVAIAVAVGESRKEWRKGNQRATGRGLGLGGRGKEQGRGGIENIRILKRVVF